MQNGHINQDDTFFTAGAEENIGDVELNTSDGPWKDTKPDVDQRGLGNKAINSSENPSETAKTEDKNTDPGAILVEPEIPKLGEVIDINMPPSAKAERQKDADPAKIIEASFDKTVIKTGEVLSPAAVKVVDKATAEFNKTGDAKKFYDTVRTAMEANLDNSYNRKLAA